MNDGSDAQMVCTANLKRNCIILLAIGNIRLRGSVLSMLQASYRYRPPNYQQQVNSHAMPQPRPLPATPLTSIDVDVVIVRKRYIPFHFIKVNSIRAGTNHYLHIILLNVLTNETNERYLNNLGHPILHVLCHLLNAQARDACIKRRSFKQGVHFAIKVLNCGRLVGSINQGLAHLN